MTQRTGHNMGFEEREGNQPVCRPGHDPAPKGWRKCYYTNESLSYRVDGGVVYLVVLIEENVAGYTPAEEFDTLVGAQARADGLNTSIGLTPDDVAEVVASGRRQH